MSRILIWGVSDKEVVFARYVAEGHLAPASTAYMGDDVPDLAVMRRCALAACPADAAADVRAISNYVAVLPGGHGAVRELIEAVMKAQNTW